MIFIYLFEADSRYLNKVDPLFNAIETGQVSGLTSLISVIETLGTPKLPPGSLARTEISRFFAETPHLEVLPVSLEIAHQAADLRSTHHYLRTPDAIQLATALVCHANTFISHDLKLLKLKIENLKIQSLSQFTL